MSRNSATPSARALARRHDIKLDQLATAQGKSFLNRGDVENAMNGRNGASSSTNPSMATYWDVDHEKYGKVLVEPVSRFAKLAAQNLQAANNLIPSVTHYDKASTEKMDSFRKSMKAELDPRGVKLSALAFHVKVLSRLLREYTLFNTSLSADGNHLYFKQTVHIGIAVDTPHGLAVPVIRDADQKGLIKIAGEVSELAARARARKIKQHETGGASMTISSLGGIGGHGFSPIVNPPEVAILGIARAEIEPQWSGDAFVPVSRVPLALSYDHRVINGALAAEFLRRYARLMSEPQELIH